MKTSTISARIDPELKRHVEDIFGELGLTASQAITLFYKQVELHRGLPFALRLDNPILSQQGQTVREASLRGKYAAVATSADEFARRKQIEIAREDRNSEDGEA